MNRVIKRLPDIRENYVGKPVDYFRGVARKIMFEEWDGPEIAMDVLPERPTRVAESSDEYECLCRCLKGLSPDEREFILDYHIYDSATARTRSDATQQRAHPWPQGRAKSKRKRP